MTKFINIDHSKPYKLFKDFFNKANKIQQSADAINISSYNVNKNEIDSRFVNLKFVDGKEFIFFSNYNSPKSIDFDSHKQISATIYWSSINIQVRMKANIKKKSTNYNNEYFKTRNIKKNALAISSNQSKKIKSYEMIVDKYNLAIENESLSVCPKYWGGFGFIPYQFEFWHGDENRLNKRELYIYENKKWDNFILEP